MKKFSIPCNFNGVKAPFTIYIGAPEDKHHPLHFQADWLSKERGGNIPSEIMDSIAKLKDLADKNSVSFEELCVYALESAQQSGENSGDEDEKNHDSNETHEDESEGMEEDHDSDNIEIEEFNDEDHDGIESKESPE